MRGTIRKGAKGTNKIDTKHYLLSCFPECKGNP